MVNPRILFLGEPAAAMRWFGYAKKLARECYANRIASKVYPLGDGIRLFVQNIFPTTGTLGGVSKVWIKASELLLLHGMFSLVDGGNLVVDPNNPESKEIWNRYVNFLEKDNDQLSPSGWKYTDKFYLQFLSENIFEPWMRFSNSMTCKKAGSFSGEMRYVVQLLAGYNKEIFYDYHSYLTHGIFVEPSTGKRYVIEISAEGIFYWKLRAKYVGSDTVRKICNLSGNADAPIPYIPIPENARPNSAIAMGISGLDFSELLSKQHLSPEIGWAFSYSGHEAQTVLLETISHVAPGRSVPGDYYKAHRYKFTFSSSVDEDGVVTISAALRDEETEWFWYEWLQNHIRIPVFTLCGPAQKRITTISLDTPVAPIDDTYTFPFYVYYTTEDVECVFRYQRGKPIVTTYADNLYPPTGLSGFNIKVDKRYNGDYYIGRVETEWDTKLTCSNSTVDFGEQRNKLQITSKTWIKQYEYSNYEYVMAVATGNTPPYVASETVVLTKDVRQNNAFWEDYLFSFTIPFFEREGFYLYQKIYDWLEDNTVTRSAEVVATKIHSPAIGAAWQVALGGFSYNGRSYPPAIYALTNRLTTTTGCSYLPDAAPPVTPANGYAVISQTIGNTQPMYQSGVQYIQTCAAYPGVPLYRGDTLKSYSYVGTMQPPCMYNFVTNEDTPDARNDTAAYFLYGTVDTEIDFSMTPLTGDLNNDNSDCTVSTPWWVVAVFDAWGANTGFITATPDELDKIKIIGNDEHYDIDSFVDGSSPQRVWDSGFFGVPYPNQL